MQRATQAAGVETAMAALLPCTAELAEKACAAARQPTAQRSAAVVDVANINSDSQVVISGHKVGVDRAIAVLKAGLDGHKVDLLTATRAPTKTHTTALTRACPFGNRFGELCR
jgi:malonyl CoA-acyl carrier protein transacylase